MNNLTVAVILTFAVLTSAQETKKENPVKTALGIAAVSPSLPLAKLLLAFRDGELKDRISQFNDFELTALLFNGANQYLQTKGY